MVSFILMVVLTTSSGQTSVSADPYPNAKKCEEARKEAMKAVNTSSGYVIQTAGCYARK